MCVAQHLTCRKPDRLNLYVSNAPTVSLCDCITVKDAPTVSLCDCITVKDPEKELSTCEAPTVSLCDCITVKDACMTV